MTVNNNLETQKLQLLQYLPEFYQEKGPGKEFLEQFLSIFEKVLNDLDDTISGIPAYFDPETVPCEPEVEEVFLKFLAQWLSLDLYELLEEKNREFILRAFEFYKKKGTVSGIENLVTFLTGKKCLVKEFTHNVIRSRGMESTNGEGVLAGNTNLSKTIDTSNPVLLSKMGTYDDEVHYVNDSREASLYNRNVIGLYIFLLKTESEFIIKEDQLHKIIDSFLPVFVRAEIFIVEENYETYGIDNIMDAFKGRAHGFLREEIPAIIGVYKDAVNWKLFYTNEGVSNDLQSRTMHDELDEEKNL